MTSPPAKPDLSQPDRRVTSLLLRALRLRCPHCGGGPIFVSWSHLVPNCPVCGLGLERGEDGYWLGAYFFNLMLVVPCVFFPYSKTLFLAFDLLIRPPSEEDFVLPHEEARNIRRKQT